MDNLTHTLTGLLIAEACLQTRPLRAAPRGFRLAALIVSGLSNNLPDFDFLYAGRGLEYLLQHRGYTHTLPLGVPLGLLSLVPIWWWRRRREPWGFRWWRYLIALALLGPAVHLALDFSNSYGVHPFWPVDDRWFYGDAVFIVEPWFLVTLVPALIRRAQGRTGKRVLGALLVLLLALGPISGMVPPAIVAALVLWAGVFWWICRRLAPSTTVWVAAGISLATCAGWFVLSARVEHAFGEIVRRRFSSARLVDLVLSPLPGNPFCYSALSIEQDGADYLVRRATVATLPSLAPAAWCPHSGPPTAPVEAVPAPPDRRVEWRDQFRAPLSELQSLARTCQSGAYLHWSRAPFWTPAVIGDLRYDSNRDRDFAELPRDPRQCPRHVPSWVPPRKELLGAAD